MTIKQWKSNPALVEKFRELISDPTFVAALGVLREAAREETYPVEVMTANAQFLLGKVEGYNLYEQRLKSLAETSDTTEIIVATYGIE